MKAMKWGKKLLLLTLVLMMVIQSALPAAAATKWYNYNNCAGTTVQINIGKTANYILLTQQKGTVNLYNPFKRKCDKTTQAYGTYRVTIVMVKDAKGRKVNKKICTNKLWMTQSMSMKLSKGTYKVTVKGLGVVTPLKTMLGFRTIRCWKTVPKWRLM